MLSEHETLELLEQLKLGVIPGTAGFSDFEADKVSHWPVLIGGGMCLNLQTVAALEFNRQPEYVYITPSAADSISCTDLASRYHQVHHLSTGVNGRTLVIAYDRSFASMLSLLQETDYHSGSEYYAAADLTSLEAKSEAGNRQYEFSQAIATSIDPGPSVNGQPVGLSFLALDDEERPLAGSWQLRLRSGESESEFFIGLINSHSIKSISAFTQALETFSITVQPERICRTNGLGDLVAELARPALIKFEKTEHRGSLLGDDAVKGSKSAGSEHQDQLGFDDLLVEKMLQLSVDDLYLLLVEAIGRATPLTFSFENDPLADLTPMQLLSEGCAHRCMAVNGLPVRQAYLVVCDGKYLLKSHE